MKVLDLGHRYELAHLDLDGDDSQILQFVKRLGTNYPGNEPPLPDDTDVVAGECCAKSWASGQ